MNKSTKTILVVAAVGLGLWYFVSQSRRIDVGAASVSRLKLEGGGVRLNIQLPIINRSDFNVPVSGFLGRLLYNGAEIGTVQQVAGATLLSRRTSILEFTTLISYLGVATSTPLLGILNSLAQEYLNISLPGIPNDTPTDASVLTTSLKSLRIVGTLYVGQVGIDINEPLTT